MMLMPKETRQGIEVTGMYFFLANCLCMFIYLLVKSFVEIVGYLFSVSEVTTFLSGWLSQDSLEIFLVGSTRE